MGWKRCVWVGGLGGPRLAPGLRKLSGRWSPLCPQWARPAVLWSFKVLARAGGLLGGRSSGAGMAQAFRGAMGAIFGGLG